MEPWNRTDKRRRIDEKFTDLVKELDDFADAHSLNPAAVNIHQVVAGWHDQFRKFCEYADAMRP